MNPYCTSSSLVKSLILKDVKLVSLFLVIQPLRCSFSSSAIAKVTSKLPPLINFSLRGLCQFFSWSFKISILGIRLPFLKLALLGYRSLLSLMRMGLLQACLGDESFTPLGRILEGFYAPRPSLTIYCLLS